MSKYIPGNDELFAGWSTRLTGYVGNHFARLGLVQADVDVLDAEASTWDAKYATHVNKRLEAKGACDMKNLSRKSYESVIRPLVARIQANPGTTDADREAMGITVRGANAPIVGAGGSMEDRPIAVIDISNRGRHVLRISNQTNTGISKGKPAGSLGCEVRRKIGSLPTDESELQLVGIATKSPYTVEYPLSEGGKMVHYMLRWVNSKGEKSAWSETESATIAA